MPECRSAIKKFSGQWREKVRAGTIEGLGAFDKLFVKNTRRRGLAGKRFFS